jgi:mannose-6-phosphate isomerase-like protein (cupin superfamily)
VLPLTVDDGETITRAPGREVVLLAARTALTVTWSRYGAGGRGPDLHVHREHTDAFYVLGGELTFLAGPRGEPLRAPAGSFVAVPPGLVHTFANASEAPADWLNVHAPDMGFAAFLRGARDGSESPWDSFAPPDDGGPPAAGVIVSAPGAGERDGAGLVKVALPGLRVVERPDSIAFAAAGERVTVTRPARAARAGH